MISNERTSHGTSPSRGGHGGKSAPNTKDDTLLTETIQIERKTFAFALKENPRGRFLRITEDVGGRRDTIIVPAPGLEEFRRVLELMLARAESSAEEAADAGVEDEEPGGDTVTGTEDERDLT